MFASAFDDFHRTEAAVLKVVDHRNDGVLAQTRSTMFDLSDTVRYWNTLPGRVASLIV